MPVDGRADRRGEDRRLVPGADGVGARALGNRSIVADPRRVDMREIINTKIKFREKFRPFAPSVLEEAVHDYFVGAVPDPFMVQVYPVRPDKRDVIPAVTHVDGSGRLQTVSRDANRRYWLLIKAFEKLTGPPSPPTRPLPLRGGRVGEGVCRRLMGYCNEWEGNHYS